jgi:hypothetical protein
MKFQKMLLFFLAATISLATGARQAQSQTAGPGRIYQQMTQTQQSAFVSAQARRIAREMSGADYQFTSAFEVDIRQALDRYAGRFNNNGGDVPGKGDLRFVFERGQLLAPALTGVFKMRNASPLMGLYIPWVESEYINLPSDNSHGALGMFQFLPKTGEHFGLSPQDLLDVGKSADAAARYITKSLETFKDDPMKEALALLSYNRGTQQTVRDLQILVNDQNKECSICALTADRSKLDETFRHENVFYVPRFFAAAIIGENPQSFGLEAQPLSKQ